MIVTCAQCQARFKLADEKLKAGGTKVRCSKCQTIFTVFPPTEAADQASAADAAPPTPAVATAAPPATPPVPETVTQEPPPEAPVPEATQGDANFDFGAEDPALAAGFAQDDFSLTETSTEAAAPPPAPPLDFTVGAAGESTADAGGFDFDSAFAEETALPPEPTRQDAGMVEFDFGSAEETFIEPGGAAAAEPPGEFDFSEPAAGEATPGEFSFDEEPATEESTEFDFSTAAESVAAFGSDADEKEPAGFGDVSFAAEADGTFAFGEQPADETPAFGEADSGWGEPASSGLGSFDFEEPTFESQVGAKTESKEPGLGFGEIDFSDDEAGGESLPSFDSIPNFTPAPGETAAPPPPPPPPAAAPVPPEQRQTTSRMRSEAPPLPLAARRSPASKMVVGLLTLLIVLCGVGGYLYVSGDGQRLLGSLVMKIKGESPSVAGDQLIGLKEITSSYINNRDSGQLLVIHGSAVNNFPSARSAIAVKGVLLDGAGNALQQQQVFCGNPLSEEKLRTLKFTEIEEAMHNQFGDSLSNLNVKAGSALKFTIVFRNVPKEMANINVEVVDSKPGSL